MTEFNFSVGDYVNTNVNGHAFIVDILRSETSDRVVVCAEFTYNFPNPRKFDMIIVEPGKMAGVEKWVVVDRQWFKIDLLNKSQEFSRKVQERTRVDDE